MEHPALISIIIPALHRPDLTAKCVESIRQQGASAGEVEIFIVENAANPALTYKAPSGVRSLLLSRNLGTTGSINHALAVSKSLYVLLLNNDVELHPGFLTALRNELDKDSRIAFVTGKLLQNCRHGHLDGAGDALLQGGGAYRLGHGDADVAQFEHPYRVLAGCGAATLFRRGVLEEIGGLDEQLFAYLDDADLGLRVHLRGYYGLYLPQATATHIGSATLRDPLHPKIVSWITRNQILLVIKNYPASLLFRLLARIVFYQVLWGLRTAKAGALLSYLQGMLRVSIALPRALKDRHQRQRSRSVTDAEFLEALQGSERQIYEWHMAQEPGRRSLLLKLYFALFGPAQR
jgi:GT2 family glycosyltransferase